MAAVLRDVVARGDLSDEPIPSSMCRFNETGTRWIILQSFADLANGDFEHTLADECLRPDRVENFFFCNQPSWSPEQIVEHGKGFRPQPDFLGTSPQALIGEVQAKRVEANQFFVRCHFEF